MMKKLLFSAAAFLCLGGDAMAQPATVLGGPQNSAPINITTATTTKIVTGNAARATDVTQLNFTSGGAGTVTLEYGTGGTCGTGTVLLTGAWTVTAGPLFSIGDGIGSLWVVPIGNDLCAVTATTATMQGSVSSNNQVGSL